MFATLRPPLLARTAAPARAAARPSQRRALSFPSVHRESPFVNGPNLKLNDGNILPDPAFDVGANLPADKVEETVTNALRAGFRHLSKFGSVDGGFASRGRLRSSLEMEKCY